jgi:uncharacterized cysteine cluster protein YcgN (CxxCxxCC family)
VKTPEECEEIGRKMKLDDFLVLPNPHNYTNLKAGYLKLKYANMLTGFVKKESVSMEDKVKAFKHVAKITGFKCKSEEYAIDQIKAAMGEIE